MAGGFFGGGDGTVNAPYLVEDAADFNAVRNNLTAHYKQTADIDLSIYNNNWLAIGNKLNQFPDPFMGVYDGGNFDISNLTTNVATSNGGIFAYTVSATIKNVNIKNTHFIGGTPDMQWVGILAAGFVNSTVTRCSTQGSINLERTMSSDFYNKNVGGFASFVEESFVSECFCDVSLDGTDVGGFATYISFGIVENCYAKGSISRLSDSDFMQVGGFAFSNNGEINKCYCFVTITNILSGRYSEGFVNQNNGTITDCYYDIESGSVTDLWHPEQWYQEGTLLRGSDGRVYRCIFFTEEWNWEGWPVIGSRWQEFWELLVEPEAKTTAEMKNIATYTGWDFGTVWGIDSNANNGYPYLQWVSGVKLTVVKIIEAYTKVSGVVKRIDLNNVYTKQSGLIKKITEWFTAVLK